MRNRAVTTEAFLPYHLALLFATQPVGVPGRIIYRSGVRVDPLEHGSLPDSEAEVIRALVDRIESLEQQVETLQHQQPSTQSVSTVLDSTVDSLNSSNHVVPSCRIRDQAIQQFLDGAGI